MNDKRLARARACPNLPRYVARYSDVITDARVTVFCAADITLQMLLPGDNSADASVTGLAFIDSKLYAVRNPSNGRVEVYGGEPLTFEGYITVVGIGTKALGLVSSDVSKCLYIGDRSSSGEIHRVNLTDKNVTSWQTYGDCKPNGLSLTNEGNLLVTCRGNNNVTEYTTSGAYVSTTTVTLPDGLASGIQLIHAIRRNGGQHLVSYVNNPLTDRVGIAGTDGKVVNY